MSCSLPDGWSILDLKAKINVLINVLILNLCSPKTESLERGLWVPGKAPIRRIVK